MTDPSLSPPGPPPAEPEPPKFIVEYGPILVFVVVYQYLNRTGAEGAIYIAAGVFAVVASLALAWSWLRTRRVPGMLLVTTAIIILSVGLAYGFSDPRFIYMKPTVVNVIFGMAAIGGVFAGKNLIALMMGGAFDMEDRAWNRLAIRWGLFFFAMAAINEIVWRTQSESFWVNFKLLGFVPLALVFALSQMPFILKHHRGELGP